MTKITRREFIEKNSLAAAGMAIAPGLVQYPFTKVGKSLFAQLPAVPYGAVYFRKSNPPKEDWERDYREAAKLGINAFRHWFLWSAIEVAPGKYDWDDYDRQLDLAARYGITTIVAEILGTAPEWAFNEYPHARLENAEGQKAPSRYTGACAVGGSPGLCLDNGDVRVLAGNFLRALAERYRDHPGMGGYDVWNEQNQNGGAGSCWCDASAGKFREWLKKKYSSLEELAEAWKRYSYRDWDDIQIPRHNGFYGDNVDWVLFRIENSHRLMKWRVDTLKSVDPDHPVTAHGRPTQMLNRIGPGTFHVWKAGELVDIYGFTGGHNFQEWSKNRWQHWCQVDLTRAGAQGRPFWAAEMPSGYAWRYHGRTWDEGRMTTADDVWLYSLTSLAGGATGVFSPRWRPLLNGWHTGNFGFCAMDGSITDRAEMGGKIATWANHPDQKELWEAKPVKGDVGIIVVPESQIQVWLLEGEPDHYYRAIGGAYQGFLFNNIQADFIDGDRIEDCGYTVLYLPHPLMLPKRVAEALKTYVQKGGILISEGCPAYFGDHGRAGENQPNYGLDELFGARESKVEFTPVLLEGMKFSAGGRQVSGGVYLQAYNPTTGQTKGTYRDGSPAVIENRYGEGKTLLIGTSPGYGYYEAEDDPETRSYFGKMFGWTGLEQHVKCSDSRLVARIHQGNGYHLLWIVNSAREKIRADLELVESWGTYGRHSEVLNNGSIEVSGRRINLDIPAREVAIVRFS